jgi:hypothetical protein
MVTSIAEEKKDEESVQQRSLVELKGGERGQRRSSTSKRGSQTSSAGGGGGGGGRSTTRRGSSSTNNKTKEDALAHLVRYETMVRQQEAEDMATLAYMKPCLERLVQLAEVVEPTTTASGGGRMDQTLSFRSLQIAREKLDAIERDPSRQSEEKEFLATDRQLLMVLRILAKDEDVAKHHSNENTTTLTWAEFVQCYKACIAGMLTLQQLAAPPGPGPASKGATTERDTYSDSLSLATLRSRTRDRTISMMSLFGPESTSMLNNSAKKASSSSRTATRKSAAARIVWFVVKAGGILLVLVASLIGVSWMYHYAGYSSSERGRTKPPRFVPLTSLYPPHFYNTSPMTTASIRGVDVPTSPPSSSGYHRHGAFPARTPPLHPKGIVPVSRAAARIFSGHDNHHVPIQSGAVAKQSAPNQHNQLTVWQHAVGGAVALPLIMQVLFPPAVAGRFVATASVLMVAMVGAATNVLASLCARVLVRLRQGLLPRPAPLASTTHP